MLGARIETFYASEYMASFVTDPVSHLLMRRRFTDLIRRRERDVTELDLFSDFYLQGANVRDAINSGERTFKDAITILKKAKSFKEWLKGQNPDNALAAEYHRAVADGSWIESTPAKVIRWGFTGGLSAAVSAFADLGTGTVVGLGLTAFDALLIERLLGGWRPDQFVEGPYKQFLGGS